MQKRHNGIRRISLSFSLPKVSSRTWGTVTKDWIDEKPTRWLASLKSVAHSSWLISTPRWLAWAFWWLVRSTRIPNASHSQQISLLRNTFDIHVSLIPLLLVTKRKKKTKQVQPYLCNSADPPNGTVAIYWWQECRCMANVCVGFSPTSIIDDGGAWLKRWGRSSPIRLVFWVV